VFFHAAVRHITQASAWLALDVPRSLLEHPGLIRRQINRLYAGPVLFRADGMANALYAGVKEAASSLAHSWSSARHRKISGRRGLACCLALIPVLLWADQGEGQTIRVTVSGDRQEFMEVEARQAPMGRVIEEIVARRGIRAHHSVLPEEPVTATCAGLSLKQVLECLLGADADLMFRSPGATAKAAAEGWPAEFWILGSSFAKGRSAKGDPDAGRCSAVADNDAGPLDGIRAVRREPAPSESDVNRLRDMADAEDPQQRAEALSRLVADGGMDEGDLRRVLERALSDADAYVRTKAVHGLARLEGQDAFFHLQTALQDSDASVRLMAVDSAGSDARSVALLEQAVADDDEVVSGLAKAKLETLATSGVSPR
jgi:hypothetical protein